MSNQIVFINTYLRPRVCREFNRTGRVLDHFFNFLLRDTTFCDDTAVIGIHKGKPILMYEYMPIRKRKLIKTCNGNIVKTEPGIRSSNLPLEPEMEKAVRMAQAFLKDWSD